MPFPAIAAAAVPYVAQGIGSYLSYRNKKKNQTPRFRDTAYGEELKRIGNEGMISPLAMRNMNASQSRMLGTRANIRKTGLRGALASRGIGRSIAGESLVDSVDAGTTKSLSEHMRNLDTRNELSKAGAMKEYGMRVDDTDTIRRGENIQRNQELFSGLTDAIGGWAGEYYQDQGFYVPDNMADMSEGEVFEWAHDNNIPQEDAFNLYVNSLGQKDKVMKINSRGESNHFFKGIQLPQHFKMPNINIFGRKGNIPEIDPNKKSNHFFRGIQLPQ